MRKKKRLTSSLTRFAFLLCRTLHIPHPDNLARVLTGQQLLDWYHVWLMEPWGDDRDDMRVTAGMGVKAGLKQFSPMWPYLRELTFEDLVRDAGLMGELQRVRNSSDNLNSAGSADGHP
jgi:hypothetical protein